MTRERRWQVLAGFLAIACAVLLMQNRGLQRTRHRDEAAKERGADRAAGMMAPAPSGSVGVGDEVEEEQESARSPAGGGGGIASHWLVKFFAPRPGETLFEYRDRVLPVVQAAAKPYRVRAARAFDDFVEAAHVDAGQRAEIEATVQQHADAIQDRIMQGVLSGEVMPPDVKPASAVAFARDILDEVDGAHRAVAALLTDAQLAAMHESRFDVAEYLALTTRWEDMLGVTTP